MRTHEEIRDAVVKPFMAQERAKEHRRFIIEMAVVTALLLLTVLR